MAITLQLSDETSSVSLLGSAYTALLDSISIPPPPRDLSLSVNALRNVRYRPRTVSMRLLVAAASTDALTSSISGLNRYLAGAEHRQSMGGIAAGLTPIKFTYQLTTAAADDVELVVLSGTFTPDTNVFNAQMVNTEFKIMGTLTLLCEPFGRLPETSQTTDTLENEVDSNANYLDISAVNVEGDSGAQLQIEITPTSWNGTKTVWVGVRSGERYNDTLFFQTPDRVTEGDDPYDNANSTWSSSTTAGFTTNASAGNSAEAQLVNNHAGNVYDVPGSRVDLGQIEYDIAGGSLPKGLFRVLARCSIDDNIAAADFTGANMKFALGWSFGGESYTPIASDDVQLTTTDNKDSWVTLDLGEIAIPPIATPSDSTWTDPTLIIKVHTIMTDEGGVGFILNTTEQVEYSVDYIQLLPVDEGAVQIDGVVSTDEILIDATSEYPGVWIKNSSDVIQRVPSYTGRPFNALSPGANTRIFWIRDDTGDPTTVSCTMNVVQRGLMQFVGDGG